MERVFKNRAKYVRISIAIAILLLVTVILITYNTQLKKELSVAQDGLSIAKDELSATKYELYLTKYKLSATKDELSVAKDEILAVKKEFSRVVEGKIIYEYRDTLEGVKEIKTEKYSVSKKEFIKGKYVEIIYPKIEIFENKELSEKINKIFYDEVFPRGDTKESILNFPGVQYIQGDYTITYFDSDIISMHINSYITRGSGVVGGSKGVTISLDDGKVLMLDSFDITINDLIYAMNTEIVYMSMTVKILYNTTDDLSYVYPYGFSIITQVNDLYTNEYDNFFLDSDGVYVIIGTRPLRAKATGYIKISYDWKN